MIPSQPALWMAKQGKDVRGGPLRDLPGTVAWANREGFDLYLSLNPSRPHGVKARRDDVLRWEHLLIDLDPFDPAPDLDAAQAAINLWLRETFSAPEQCFHVIDSGRGRQLWLTVEDGHLTEDRSQVERASHTLLHTIARELHLEQFGLILDTSTSDLPRVGRCPGSINSKTGRTASVLGLALGRIKASHLLDWTYDRSDAQTHRPAPPPLLLPNLHTVLPHLTPLARDFLTTGVPEGGRHAAAWHTARSLCELSIPIADTMEWVLRGAARCWPALLDETNLRRSVEGAYQCNR